MKPIDRVLERLDAVRRVGSGWIARCPVHGDRNPSLSIRLGTKVPGCVMLKCQSAGCSAEEIVEAMGLTMCDLFPDSRTRKAGWWGEW